MANKHQQFIREAWPTLTGNTSEIESIWREVVGNEMPHHEKGHALFLMGFWNFYRDTPPGKVVYTPNEYRTYLEERFAPKPEPGPEPELPTGGIYSDFLSWYRMNLLLPAFPLENQRNELWDIRKRGYKDVDIYAYNRNDNPYRESHWKVDASRNPDQVITTLRLAREAGLRTTLWCFGDELGGMSKEEAMDKLRSFVPILDPWVTRYVYALEMNESWDSDTNIEIATVLAAQTKKDYYIHWTRGINAGTSFPRVKGIYYQYEGKTPTEVSSETRRVIGKWTDAGKEFIAGEFPFDVVKNNPKKAENLGDAVDSLVAGRANG